MFHKKFLHERMLLSDSKYLNKPKVNSRLSMGCKILVIFEKGPCIKV